MRFFNLLNIQHLVAAVFPALLMVFLVGTALAYSHIRRKDSDLRHTKVVGTYPDEIQERNAPFPLFLALVILGTVLWAVGYTLISGITGRVI